MQSIVLTEITTVQNEVAVNYDNVRGLYFLAVIFAVAILLTLYNVSYAVYSIHYYTLCIYCTLCVQCTCCIHCVYNIHVYR